MLVAISIIMMIFAWKCSTRLSVPYPKGVSLTEMNEIDFGDEPYEWGLLILGFFGCIFAILGLLS